MTAEEINLPDDLLSPKLAVEESASGGNNKGKARPTVLDVVKDHATSENNIPLSPQWLHAKSNESKNGLPTTLGGMRSPNSLPHGTSSDFIRKDSWRLEGSQEKREQRRNVLDIGKSCWDEDERETGLLGRRECKREGDRGNENRKYEHRSDSVSNRETADSKSLDRRHEVNGRSPGNATRRESKCRQGRWGSDDKEKDSRLDKKINVDKEDAHIEKQSLIGSNRAVTETESRDKWRPRHRQEVSSHGSSVYHAAFGSGLERVRGEGSKNGFAPGRGKANFLGSLAFNRISSAGSIGAVSANKSDSAHGNSGVCAGAFHYPRGKLLDIYRKQMIFSTFDAASEDFEEIPPLTQFSSIQPLAFVRPDAVEMDLLEDISKGKVFSSEFCNSEVRNMGRISESKTDFEGKLLVEEDHGILSNSWVKERSCAHFAGYDASCKKDVNFLEEKDCENGECIDDLIDGMDPGTAIQTDSKDISYCVNGVPNINSTDCELSFGKKDAGNGNGFVGHTSALSSAPQQGINSASCFDDITKLPDDSNGFFDPSSIQEMSNTMMQHQKVGGESKLSEKEVPPEELSLLYQDPQGNIQGPYLGADIVLWLDQGFFNTDLHVCLSDAPEGTPFQKLGEVMPQLKLKCHSRPLLNPGDELRESNDIIEADPLDTGFTCLSAGSDHQNGCSEFEGSLGYQVQPSICKNETVINPLYEESLYSNSETLPCANGERRNIWNVAAQEAEEMLYYGRLVNGMEKQIGILADDIPLSRSPSDNHALASNMEVSNHNIPTDNGLNHLGFLWSEFEENYDVRNLPSNGRMEKQIGILANDIPFSRSPGSNHALASNMGVSNHNIMADNGSNDLRFLCSEFEENYQSRKLPSNVSGIGEQGRVVNLVPRDFCLFDRGEERSSIRTDSSFVHDSWSNICKANCSSGVLQDDMVSHSLSSLKPEYNHFSLQDEHLLSQKFHMQQLHQQHVVHSQQQLPMKGPFLRQVEKPPVRQSMSDLERLVLFRLQEDWRLQKLLDQQQLHRQQQQVQLLQQHRQQRLQKHLIAEQMLQKQLREPYLGASHISLLREDGKSGQFLSGQCLSHEFHQHSYHLPEHHDSSLEQFVQAKLGRNIHHEHHDILSHDKDNQMLHFEQQLLLGLQQDQVQSPEFSMVSRQPLGMEEQRYAVGFRSVDESGPFTRAGVGPPLSQCSRHSQLDFLYPTQRPSSFEQSNHLKQNYSLHEEMQAGLHKFSSQPLGRRVPLSVGSLGTPGLNIDTVNASALQGLDVGEQHNRMHSSGQILQFPSGISSDQHRISSQFIGSHLDETENQWTDPNGQLAHNLLELPFSQLCLEAEQLKRDMKVNQSIEDRCARTPSRNDESSRWRSGELLHRKQVLPSSRPLGITNGSLTSCFENKKPSRLFYGPVTDHSFHLPAEGMVSSFKEGFPAGGQALQEQLVDEYLEEHAHSIGDSGIFTFQSGSSMLDQQSMTENEIEEYLYSVTAFPGLETFSNVNGGKRGKMEGSKFGAIGRSIFDLDSISSGVEQSRVSVMDNGELIVASVGHDSFGITGGNEGLHTYEEELHSAYSKQMVTGRMPGILPNGTGNTLKHTFVSHAVLSHESLPDLASAPFASGKNPTNFLFSEDEVRKAGGISGYQTHDAPASKNEGIKQPESLLGDTLKSSKRPSTAPQTAEAPETTDGGSNNRSSGKKKGKKGKQIDPSLLGFKVHSNRILMGEIYRPDD